MASSRLKKDTKETSRLHTFLTHKISPEPHLPPEKAREALGCLWGCCLVEVQIDGLTHLVPMDPETSLLDASPKTCTHRMAEPRTIKELASGAWH